MTHLELYNKAEFIGEYVREFPFGYDAWWIKIPHNGIVDRLEMYQNEIKVAVLYDQDTTQGFIMPKKLSKETRKKCIECGGIFYTVGRKGLKRRCPACVDKENR